MVNHADFEFETNTLSAFKLESDISNYCRVGDPIRSNLGKSLSPTFQGRVNIYADDGRVECNVTFTPTESSKYLVNVTGVNVTGKRGKPYIP